MVFDVAYSDVKELIVVLFNTYLEGLECILA